MSVQNTHYGADGIAKLMQNCKSVFFIGIGGISMSALALLLKHNGFTVGGSDRAQGPCLDSLRQAGIDVFSEHRASHVISYGAVVYTVAIDAENPEYAEAKRRGIPLISRSDFLGYLMMGYRNRIGVAGMHGKSTCTAMCARIFLAAADPTVLCGASMSELGNSSCRIGKSREHFVFEACEYMDSFLDFSPSLAVLLNIGMDHVDYFHSMEQIHESFLKYANRVGTDGCVLYNGDDVHCAEVMQRFEGKRMSFGLRHGADYTARNIRLECGIPSFELYLREERLCEIRLRVFGKHNVYNALAAAAAAHIIGVAPSTIAEALSGFSGAHRRMERKGRLNGAVVYDDYGHHPDEIRATLQGAREMGFLRVLCAYQPHTYSRTAGLLSEFSKAFADVDRVFFADIYPAREQNVYGVSSADIASVIGEKALYCGSFAATAEALKREAREGDLIIVMGAGDIYRIFDLLELRE